MAVAEGNADVPDDDARPASTRRTTAGGGGYHWPSAVAAYTSSQYGGHRCRDTGESDGSHSQQQQQHSSGGGSSSLVSSVAKSWLPAKRRLNLDPATKLYFPHEPGKQVRSAIRIKNVRKSHTAFKFQTNSPKSCFMRPPGGILAPGASIIATVFKFVESPEDDENQSGNKLNVKFKILSLKVKPPIDYVPALFDERKDQVSVEQILRVVFLDIGCPSREMEKLKNQLAEADAALEARKQPTENKEREETCLTQQHGEAIDSK